jgi:hypothetical protein
MMTEAKNETFYSIFGHKCKRICGIHNDCLKEDYQFEYNRIYYPNEKLFQLVIDKSRYTNLIIKHSAEIQFEEFIFYIASIISLWF